MATRTFTHLYDSYGDAVQTVQALKQAGVPESDISLVSNNSDSADAATDSTATGGVATDTAVSTGAGTGATVGTLVGGGAGLLAGIGALAIPGIGPVVAAGWLIATLAGAGIGAATGGLLGSLTGAGVSEEDANTYLEGVRRGGTLVTVRADETMADKIETVFSTRSAVDIAARRAEYRNEGWTKYDPSAPAYTAEQVRAERSRRVRVY